jgi:hypothetical protein
MAEKCEPNNVSEPVREDYTRLRKCIADLYALVLPMVEPQETRPSKRTRTGLSVAEREARAAFQLMKDEKRREIAEFRQNYKGPPYHPIERCLWSTLCRSYECPMNLEAFGHEIGEDCLLDPKEVWKLPPIEDDLDDLKGRLCSLKILVPFLAVRGCSFWAQIRLLRLM